MMSATAGQFCTRWGSQTSADFTDAEDKMAAQNPMPAVLAVCDTCGTPFPSGIFIENSTNISMTGNSSGPGIPRANEIVTLPSLENGPGGQAAPVARCSYDPHCEAPTLW